jgi:hypothetical protein
MKPEDSPHLYRYLRGYWHQDHEIYGESVEAVTDAFVADTDPPEQRALLEELNVLLAGGADERELQSTVFDDGPGSISPEGFGSTAVEWLDRVRRQLVSALETEA